MTAPRTTPMTTEAIAHLLWRTDPMGTGCTENDGMEDEYTSEASEIAERLAQGEDPRSATVAVFEFWFWEGCMDEDRRREALDTFITLVTAMTAPAP